MFSEADDPMQEIVEQEVVEEGATMDAEDDPMRNLIEERSNFEGWHCYKIPWSKITAGDLQLLRDGADDPLLRSRIVIMIISDMRFYSKNIGREVCRNIGKQLVQKFPRTFEDKDDRGGRLGDGFSRISDKLENRAFYMERPHVTKKSLSDQLKIHSKYTKLKKSLMAGTKHWQPKDCPPNETDVTLQEKKNILNSLSYENHLHESDVPIVNEYLEATFFMQRLFLNRLEKIPTITEIRETWACILSSYCLLWHFEKMIERKIDTLITRFEEKAPTLLNYGFLKRFCAQPDKIPQENRYFQALDVVCKHFKEMLSTSFITFPVSF